MFAAVRSGVCNRVLGRGSTKALAVRTRTRGSIISATTLSSVLSPFAARAAGYDDAPHSAETEKRHLETLYAQKKDELAAVSDAETRAFYAIDEPLWERLSEEAHRDLDSIRTFYGCRPLMLMNDETCTIFKQKIRFLVLRHLQNTSDVEMMQLWIRVANRHDAL